MDQLGVGAVPALIGRLLRLAALATAAATLPALGCSVAGTWKIDSEPMTNGNLASLTSLVPHTHLRPIRSKDPQVLSGRNRGKPLYEATHVVITGRTVMDFDFRDAGNRSRVITRAEGAWRCDGDALVLRSEGWAGNARQQWLERRESRLVKTREGDLLWTSTTKVVDPPGNDLRPFEARFRPHTPGAQRSR